MYFCQDKNNWCGYYYSFSCWCNWRSLSSTTFVVILCMIEKSWECISFLSESHAIFDFTLCSGLDDLRDWTNNVQPHVPIYVAQRDFEVWTLLLLFLHLIKVFLPWNHITKRDTLWPWALRLLHFYYISR